jgi:hypothetical protein
VISAKVICDSVSPAGVRLTTFELEYPRIVHSEFMTHAMICKNAASSRAIPLTKMKEQLLGRPVRFGEANPGMQDKGVAFNARVKGYSPEDAWECAKEEAVRWSQAFYEAGYHKQCYNRLTEPFQLIKVVASATEWNNFFWLRDDGAADPSLHELAATMREAREESSPIMLSPGQWHLPYVDWAVSNQTEQLYWKNEHGTYQYATWEDLKKVSAARCAAVSFRNTDYTLQKCLEVFDRLVGDQRKHASAFQHQATPMNPFYGDVYAGHYENDPTAFDTWEPGISHVDRNGQLWSAQYRGWIMHRKLIPGENVPG